MSVGLRCGVYEHYKGKRYLVLGVARHTETGELMAVYVPLYELPEGDGVQMSVRPLEMFTEFRSRSARRAGRASASRGQTRAGRLKRRRSRAGTPPPSAFGVHLD